MMNKKTTASLSRIILTSFVMLLGIAAVSSAADIVWSNGALPVDGDWNNAANWTGGVKPNTTTDYARIRMTTGPVFIDGRIATTGRVTLKAPVTAR